MRGGNCVGTRMRAKEGRREMMWVEHVCGTNRMHPLRLPCSCVLLPLSAFLYIDVVTSGWKHCSFQQYGPVPPQPMLPCPSALPRLHLLPSLQGYKEAVHSNLDWFEGTGLILASDGAWIR